MFKSSFTLPVVAAISMALFGCGKSDKTSSSSGAQPETANAAVDSAQAKEVFNSRCATCHGSQGLGDGPGAVALNPKPRNYHDRTWQTKVTDADIRKTITYGGAAVGKSPMMPASPDLEAKPEVIEGLVRIVREFGKS
jgi:mono/diheme cytochrome c family protein